jgi:LPXTG-motif cell wall-anchored protein
MIESEDNIMFKKIRAVLLAGIVASALAVSAGAQTEDFSYWPRKGSSNGLIVSIGALALIIIIGLVFMMRRRNDASK